MMKLERYVSGCGFFYDPTLASAWTACVCQGHKLSTAYRSTWIWCNSNDHLIKFLCCIDIKVQKRRWKL